MTAPRWLNAVLREFGEGIELKSFELNEQNAALLQFETGSSLRFEYAHETLVVAMLVPAPQDAAVMRRMLIYTQPERRPAFRLRAGYLAKSAAVCFAAQLAEREVSLPSLNAVFQELWRRAEDFRRRLA